MKTSQDPRHQKRINRIEGLFSYSFYDKKVKPDIEPIVENLSLIDKTITIHAPEWPIDKLAKIDLAILRLAVYELLFEKDTPPKVVIDEAIEIAKEYGTESSSSFVNGVIGSAIKKSNLDVNQESEHASESKDSSN